MICSLIIHPFWEDVQDQEAMHQPLKNLPSSLAAAWQSSSEVTGTFGALHSLPGLVTIISNMQKTMKFAVKLVKHLPLTIC